MRVQVVASLLLWVWLGVCGRQNSIGGVVGARGGLAWRAHREVTTNQGAARGYQHTPPAHYAFLGLPYASPPTHRDRFKVGSVCVYVCVCRSLSWRLRSGKRRPWRRRVWVRVSNNAYTVVTVPLD